MPSSPWRAIFLVSLLLVGCHNGSTDSNGSASGPQWIATTGHIDDALRRITDGTDVNIRLFCGPGVDPHSFSASTRDVQAMENADAIFYNGFHLEAKLHDLLHHRYGDKSWSMSNAFPEDARLDWEEDGQVDPDAPYDPHIWNHLPAWSECVAGLIDRLCEIDPANADTYRTNGDAYLAEINQTHQWAIEQFESIPKSKRLLVSAHDAFNYFARVYEFETVAVLGIGNDAEADVKTMRDVATTVCDRKVPVIFLETITNPKVSEALQEACQARDWSVQIADQPLYSDDLGPKPPHDTFLGAFKSNVELITSSLAGDGPSESGTVEETPAGS